MESESHFNNVLSLGQVEPVQDGRQPGVEVPRFAAQGRSIKLRKFETSTKLEVELGRGGVQLRRWCGH